GRGQGEIFVFSQSQITNHQSPVPSHLFSEYMLQKSKNWVNKCQAMQRILKESQRNKLYPQESVSLNI
ncbi:hypothetical protein, partial [Sphaerospermopsis sp. LEGE 00249]|uniref:hypothetical protein n=1 Tax=Sphaerospermopsis sp. LEGE 00249 TaxID=1380707 RepID=UPI001C9A8711